MPVAIRLRKQMASRPALTGWNIRKIAWEGAKNTTPAGGGGPAGVVWFGQRSGGGEGWPYPLWPGRRMASAEFDDQKLGLLTDW